MRPENNLFFQNNMLYYDNQNYMISSKSDKYNTNRALRVLIYYMFSQTQIAQVNFVTKHLPKAPEWINQYFSIYHWAILLFVRKYISSSCFSWRN